MCTRSLYTLRDDLWLNDSYSPPPTSGLVCNKAKIADNSIQLNSSHALQPHYKNETLHSSVSTKDELK